MNQLFKNGDHELRVLGSSSSGNCYILDDDIMIDCGLPFEKIKDYIINVSMIWISHIHGDHLKIETIKQIKTYMDSRNQNIGFYGNEEVIEKLAQHGIEAHNVEYTLSYKGKKMLICTTFELSHSVQNNGIAIFEKDMLVVGIRMNPLIVFATDTNKVPPHFETPDFLVLESNYFKGTYEAFKLAAKQLGEYHNDHTMYHLSADEADKYIVECADEQTVIIEAHQSGLNRPRNNNLQITLEQVKQRIKKNKGRDYV